MEPNQQPPAATTVASTPTAKPSKFGAGSITFLVGLLLFLLPFVNIKCGEMTIKQVKGYELATGFTVDDKSSSSSYTNTYIPVQNQNRKRKIPTRML